MTPYRRPELNAKAAQAIAEVVQEHRKLLDLRDRVAMATAHRADAVKRAQKAGASLREIGDPIGMTGEAVRQMAKLK